MAQCTAKIEFTATAYIHFDDSETTLTDAGDGFMQLLEQTALNSPFIGEYDRSRPWDHFDADHLHYASLGPLGGN